MKIWLFVLFVVGVVHCKTRNYYIAAEEIQWNYAPSGMDNFAQLPLEESEDASTFFEQNNERIGGTYIKALYIGYTDDTFTERIERKREEQHLGFLGPVIYGEVGDTLKIHFLNRCTRPYSIHAQGIKTNRDDEGASVPGNPNPNSGGNSVEPGEEHVYTWNIPTRSGPSIGDWSSSVWIYTSHVDVVKDSNSGLLGAVVITRHGMADNDGKPKDVDKELFTLYSVFDENQSHYLEDNIRTFIGPNVSLDDVDSDGFQESNLMHGINGYLYINGGPNEVTQGERARWYLLSLGTEVDIHTAHWHGQTLINSFGHRVDVSVILPATVDVLDMYGDNPGIWFMHCMILFLFTTFRENFKRR
eukprot:TRINITY_DN3543_c0_g1_i4.p1 TRINITY_DN3543_c0_g1~~TRINITY_DN3543_c0_g1_i4.p1  ORF type:complete len:359 (+),score=131.70 TRINITY_DN3543_c0_g1_i4:52-1128(+)